MGPLALAGIGAGVGLGKSLLDQQQEKRDRQEAAMIAQWSPWTGMQPEKVKRTDYLGNAMQGGMTGASLGQNMANSDAYNAYLAKQGPTPGATAVAPPGAGVAPRPGNPQLGSSGGYPAQGAALAPPPAAVVQPQQDAGYGWFNGQQGSPWFDYMTRMGNGYGGR